ncbi:MAG: DNA polymerase III subunit delta [Clostridium sp.]|uniref:DNA polymerase III subunit delta n=1 Tax=Clostridium sp. TaxID=1506 RepID=UPI0030615750
MITLEQFEKDLKQNNLKNCYVFCGSDEGLIKANIKRIKDLKIDETFADFNFNRIEGDKLSVDALINNCETIPFMAENRMVEIYRANFLKDGKKEDKSKDIDELRDYLKTIPPYTTLVMYYVFEDDREKQSNKLRKLQNVCEIVKVDKLKGQGFQSKVKSIFEEKGKDIGKSELGYFCSIIENNMSIVNNEIEKLILYTGSRAITKEDIVKMAPYEKESDIFNLVSYLSERNIKGAIDTLNQLVYRGEKPPKILSMIERQFKLLFAIRVKVGNGAKKEAIVKEYNLNPYIADKMIVQSKKFSEKALRKSLELCLDTEVEIKSKSVDSKNAIEMLMVRTMMTR